MIQTRCDSCGCLIFPGNPACDPPIQLERELLRVEIRVVKYNGHEDPTICARCATLAAGFGKLRIHVPAEGAV